MKRPVEDKLVIVDDVSVTHSSALSSVPCSPLPTIDPVAEKKLKTKCDLHVLPILSVMYMLSFIDRINIGNARIQGLTKDLGLKGSDYNIALFVFFIPYIVCEVPSNIILRKVAPSTWISGIMFSWGVYYQIQRLF
jgi:hypothetical protein